MRCGRSRDWTGPDGSYQYEGTLTPDKGARFKTRLAGFTDQVFDAARRAGIRDSYEAYAADGLVRMAEAALTGGKSDENGNEPPVYTKSRVHLVVMADAAAWQRGHTEAGETCEIAGIGPIDIATARRLCGDAVVDIVLTHGVDVRALAARAARPEPGAVRGAARRGLRVQRRRVWQQAVFEVDHLGEGWAINGVTVNGAVAFKCTHCHDLKTYKGWRDGPRLPNGKRTLIPPERPPPDG